MRKYLCAAAVAAVAALLTAIPALASSNAVLSDTAANPNGTQNTAGPTIVGTNSGQAKITTTSGGSTGIFCNNSATSATLNSNPTAPGTADLSLNSQTFSNCSINIFGTRSVNSITVDHLAYDVKIKSGSPDSVTIAPGSNGAIHVTAVVTTIFGQQLTCGYHVHDSSGDVFGTAASTLVISNQQFDGDGSNNFQCTSSAFLSVTYTQNDGSSTGPAVFAN